MTRLHKIALGFALLFAPLPACSGNGSGAAEQQQPQQPQQPQQVQQQQQQAPGQPEAPQQPQVQGTASLTSAAGKVVLITGSTDGLGREVALQLAATGAHIIVHGRNRERGMQVVSEIEKAGKGSARFYEADLASFSEVRQFANTILKDYQRLDVLINNAGIWLRNATTRELSADGNELTFQVNYLSGFLLTHMLKPLLIKSAPSRIINVASRTQNEVNLDDPNQTSGFSGQFAYGQSKLAQVMFTIDLARELEGTGVTVNAVHPASQMDTRMVRDVGNIPRTTVEEGAASVMNLVQSANPGTGQFYDQLQQSRALPQAYEEEARQKLKEISRRLTGVK
jgi:NAD(P)-dependent dehydrogenase (short-subunit alcohol dehydrogenase family)